VLNIFRKLSKYLPFRKNKILAKDYRVRQPGSKLAQHFWAGPPRPIEEDSLLVVCYDVSFTSLVVVRAPVSSGLRCATAGDLVVHRPAPPRSQRIHPPLQMVRSPPPSDALLLLRFLSLLSRALEVQIGFLICPDPSQKSLWQLRRNSVFEAEFTPALSAPCQFGLGGDVFAPGGNRDLLMAASGQFVSAVR
jgi:hypothetical protein